MNREELPIATPCNADWTTMSLADRSRFCGACQKHVHELSRLSEGEARALLASPTTEGLCVRYLYDERGEIVFRRSTNFVPVTQLARMKRAALAAVATASLAVASAGCSTSTAGGQAHPEDETRYAVMMGAPVAPPATTDDAGASTAVVPTTATATPDGGAK